MHVVLKRPVRVLRIAAAMFPLVVFIGAAHADIFQWEYINPADPSQGKRQSTTLAPNGAGVDAVPGADLSWRNLTMTYLIGADLTNADGYYANLTDADLSQANLINAYFRRATLSSADFTGSEIRGANFVKYREPNGGIDPGQSGDEGGTGITLDQIYSTASYQAHDLSRVNFGHNDLTGGNFFGQRLVNTDFSWATITDADFTDAHVEGANFGWTTYYGFTLSQLYSTASYQARDLSGIGLSGNNLACVNFAGQNLTNASFYGATLTGADFTGAEVRGAYFGGTSWSGFTAAQLYSTASYQAHDLTAISLESNNMTGWTFAGQNLTNANFFDATLTDADFREANLTNANLSGAVTAADFTGAVIHGARISAITLAQLYSTASYQEKDLSGIGLSGANLAGGNFAGQNLTNADFGAANLTDARFRQANLVNARFFYLDSCAGYCIPNPFPVHPATLAGADLTAADVRGAERSEYWLSFSSPITTNLIRPDGHISGLNLDSGGVLVVRDYDGNPLHTQPSPIPLTVDQRLAMGPGGTLRMVFEADEWDSTISFAPRIPVALGGTLELTFADDVNLASQVGRTFDLFNWTGVNPTGAFTVSSLYGWDLSNLYTTGEVTLSAVPEPRALLLFGFVLCVHLVIGRGRLS